MPDMVKERIVVVEEGADLLRDSVVREPAQVTYGDMADALRVCRLGGTVMLLAVGWVVLQPLEAQ